MERIGWQNTHVLLKEVNEAINNWNISICLVRNTLRKISFFKRANRANQFEKKIKLVVLYRVPDPKGGGGSSRKAKS